MRGPLFAVTAATSLLFALQAAAPAENTIAYYCGNSLQAIYAGSASALQTADLDGTGIRPTEEQREKVLATQQLLITTIQHVGQGAPINSVRLNENSKSLTFTAQRWTFPNGRIAYVGCTRVIGPSGLWQTEIRLGDTFEQLQAAMLKVEKAAGSPAK